MKVLVTGSTGLVGTELVVYLEKKGCQVSRLVRHRGNFSEPQIAWNPDQGKLNPNDLEGFDVVVHLAGENIASGRWTEEKKKKIRDSRVLGTRLLSETLAKLNHPPSTLICASAIGYYGDRQDEVLTEVSAKGKGFLADTCKQWEESTAAAHAAGIRVINTRFGIILSPKGGALKAMYWPFKLGLAGELGNGKQYMSWIVLQDVIQAIHHVMLHPELRGPVNVVAPEPVTNAVFTDAMRKTLIWGMLPMHYWTPPAPALAVKGLLGQMGDELLLGSTRVLPVQLQESGFHFEFSQLKPALEHIL